MTNRAAAITDAEFSGSIQKVYEGNGVEVHRKATGVMAVWQISTPIDGDPIPAKLIPEGAVPYDEFEYGWKRYVLYYEELNGETQER